MLKFSSIAKLAAVTVISAAASVTASAADRISDFSLIDHNGRFFQLSRNLDSKAIVIMAYDQSRDARRAARDFAKLAEQYPDATVEFALIDSSGNGDKDVMREEMEDRGLDLRVFNDESQLVAEELGLANVGDTAIIDPNAKELVFLGAFNKSIADGDRSARNSATYAEDALTAFLADESFEQGIASSGSSIEFAAKAAHESLSYANDVAPILEERCVSCHVEGGIAPFAMSNHQMVQGWSPMIREVLYTKRMPPGQIDDEFVDMYHDVYHITPEETQTLVHWIDNGAKNTDGTDPLAALDVEPAKWLGGTPDMIIDIPEQKIPATGVQDYRNLMIPLEIDEPIWVKAIEFEAGDPTVLHHIIAFTYGPGGLNEFEVLNQGIGLGAYAPGNELNLYPEGSGYQLVPGGGMMLQMHYTTSGKEAVDASQIALYLHDEEPERQILGGSASDLDINIPAFEENHEMVASKKFRKDSYLTMVGPHMHYRGYDANFKLVYPDGEVEEILNVPNYQFNWQKTYDFKEPKFLPAGTEMVFRATFDNSENNPFNPDPSQQLSRGEQTWQEMFFGFFRYVEADAGGED